MNNKESYSEKKYLVTGASGFIGSRFAAHLSGKGLNVVGWTRTDCPSASFPTQVVNLSDSADMEAALLRLQPDVIIHCAGSADVGKSVRNPDADFLGNVTLTHNLLFGLQKSVQKKVRVVFLSSAGVYGNPACLPITEDMPTRPLSPYALHKVMCEEMCRFFISHYGMDIKIARIFSAYGPGLRKQIFWDMHRKLQDTGRLDMFGTGRESRDYIFIDDVIQALDLLTTADTEDVIFNVANGEEITIRQAAELFARSSGVDTDRIAFNNVVREGDPLNWRADISKLRKLGYEKTVEMRDGISAYCAWAKEQV